MLLKRRSLSFCGEYSSPRKFYKRLEQVNNYLNFFPWQGSNTRSASYAEPLSDNDLMDILDKAHSTDIRKLMLANGDHQRKHNTAKAYSERLEDWHKNAQLAACIG